MATERMRKEYDFWKGTRGKFHRPGASLCLPIYLDKKALAFVQAIARKKGMEVSAVASQLILSNKRLADVLG